MMKRLLASAALISLIGATFPHSAGAFTSRGGARVNPVNDAVFEVVARSSGGGPSFWCGAADYAHRVLKAEWTAQLYIARSLGQSVTTGRKSAVQFTLNPKAAGIKPIAPQVSLSSLKVGDNMSVQRAFTYCQTGIVGF